MTKFLEIIDIIKLALQLYKRAGYEFAKKRLVDEINRRDDDYTTDELRDILS